ncbi:MAG: BT_3928 family protein [bacterium]
MMKLLRLISRILVGIVFVFSGFVKAIDPLGSTYKFGDYFTAFGIGFLEPLAFPLAILLSSIELIIGVGLLLSYRMKVMSWLVLIFMSFFTVLTFILALTNPVTDCGCFGDALILTNWETFAKNVVILALTLIIFIYRKQYPGIRSAMVEWSVLVIFFLGTVFLSLYCYNNLPLLDFRPYGIGANIPDAMTIPDDAPQAEYETRLYYKNLETGRVEEFNMDDFPQDTTKWEFEDAETKLVSEGYEPPIHDFNIMAPNGNEITGDILSFDGYSFILVSYNANEANVEALQDANDFFRLAQVLPDVQFHAVSSTLREDLDSLREEYDLLYDFSQADEITLKTIVRSNPGLLLIKNGTITGKWHYRNLPDRDYFPDFESLITNYPFCTGCDLRVVQTAPPGAMEDQYETRLYYRNLATDSIHEFTMDNFPSNSTEWLFENSVSRKISSGFEDPLSKIEIKSMYGMDMSEVAFFNDAYSLLIFVDNPSELSEDEFQAMNKFGGMAGEYLPERVDVFPVVAMNEEELMEFTNDHISPFDYYMADEKDISDLAGDSIRIVLLNDGKVLYNQAGQSIPDPSVLLNIEVEGLEDSETVIKPVILTDMRINSEKRLVYIFIFGFLLVGMILRIYLDRKKSDV